MNIDHKELASKRRIEQPEALRAAAQAVIDRWETPLWKDVPATAEYIAALRDALAADHFEDKLAMVARWYMVNRDGMATLCTDREDAEKEASDAQSVWPHMGPHRAVQLVEAADVEALRARSVEPAGEYPALPVPVFESWAQGGLLREAGFTADQMRAYADRAMRAAQPAPENIRSILARCRDFIDTAKAPAYPAGADLADEIDALLAAQPIDAMLGEQAELRRLSDCCPELNLSNYGHDDVDELNGWAIEVSQCIDRALAAQPAGAQQPGVATWMPLPGVLPEPGKPVLLDIGKKRPIRAMWAAKHTIQAADDDSDWGEYDKATDTYYCPEGWYEWNEQEDVHWRVDKTPVAWCELPPKVDASHGQAPAPAQAAHQQEAPAMHSGWVSCTIEFDGSGPEEVAYGPKIMMDRLAKWLGKHFERTIAEKAAPQPLPASQGDALDAARLDWLDEDDGSHVSKVGKTWYTRPAYGRPYRKHKNLRAAIDAARNQGEKL